MTQRRKGDPVHPPEGAEQIFEGKRTVKGMETGACGAGDQDEEGNDRRPACLSMEPVATQDPRPHRSLWRTKHQGGGVVAPLRVVTREDAGGQRRSRDLATL